MGMFDSFFVPKKNKVSIPVAKDEYQTKDFDCALSQFTITEDGVIIYTPPTNPEWTGGDDGLSKFVQQVKNGEFNNPCFNLYGDDESGKWHEFEIVVLNNQILRVKDYGELLYLNPDYPMLDEALNPVPDGHRLTVLKTLGVVFEEHRLNHFSFTPETLYGKQRGKPHPIFNNPVIEQQMMSSKHCPQCSLTDLELMYPNRARLLFPFSLEPRPGDGKMLLIKRDTQTSVEEEFDPTEENMSKFNFSREQLRMIENVKLVNNVRGDMSFSEFPAVELFNPPAAKIHAEDSMDKLGTKFIKEDGSIDVPLLFEHLHGVPLTEVLGDLKNEKRLEGFLLNSDGSLDLMKLTSKAERFSKVGIRRNQVEPQQLKDAKVITSPSFGRKIYIEGLTGLYKDLINSESRSAGKSLLSIPALKDSSYSEPGEHQRCRDRLEKHRTVKFTSIPVIIGGPETSRSYRLCDKCYNKLHGKDASLNPAECPNCKEVGIYPKIERDDFEGDVTYFSDSDLARMVKLNLTYGKSMIVFHRDPNMFRAGKKNHRYSQCIKQITIGLSKKNYLSTTASIKTQLEAEDVKEIFTAFNPLINKP